jgi:Flp pilus assembly protein TadB
MISESLQIKKRVKKSMNKIVQTIIIAIFLVALIFLITIVGILMLIVVSAVGIVIAVLIEGARNEKKKERFADDFCFEVVHLHPKETSVCV